MNIPGWHLHPLSGAPAGRWSVWVSGNWRLVFAFEGEDAIAVDYVDYHEEGTMGRMYNPPHPGETIGKDILPALGLSVTKAAEQLGVTRVALARVIHGKAAISATMARRLEAWLNGPEHGPSAESWLRGQLAYDLRQAEQRPRPRVQSAPAPRLGTSDIPRRAGLHVTTAASGKPSRRYPLQEHVTRASAVSGKKRSGRGSRER